MSSKENNAGCKSCRYYSQNRGDCYHEDFYGQYQKKGLIGECVLFKSKDAELPPLRLPMSTDNAN